MNKKYLLKLLLPVNISIVLILILLAILGNRSITALSENVYNDIRPVLVIDAGHGGIDGGATSCTGILESKINLEIALRLSDLVQLLGIKSIMIRSTDCSIHTKGESIAAQKISDLKNRLEIINNAENDLFISIHQNYFNDQRYSGAQVFYNNAEESIAFAKALQSAFVSTINQGSNRKAKRGAGIYLLEKGTTTGALVECGFISNPAEEELLLSADYQKKVCCVIAATCVDYLFSATP